MSVINKTEVRINGEIVDIAGEVSSKFQGINLADPSIAFSDYTEQIEIIETAASNRILNHANNPSVRLDQQLQDLRIDVTINGVPVFNNARAFVASTQGNYKLNIVDGNREFFERLEGKNIRDLTFTQDFNWTMAYAIGRLNGVANYTSFVQIPAVEYANLDPENNHIGVIRGELAPFGSTNIMTNQCLPWFRKLTIWNNIFSQSGMMLQNQSDFHNNNPTFGQTYICSQPYEDFKGFVENELVTISEWLPDVSQADFIKDILKQYGQYLIQDGDNISVNSIEDFYSNTFNAIDWTDKIDVSTKPEIIYNTGFEKNNIYGYAERTVFVDQAANVIVQDYNMQSISSILTGTLDWIRLPTQPPAFRESWTPTGASGITEIWPRYMKFNSLTFTSGTAPADEGLIDNIQWSELPYTEALITREKYTSDDPARWGFEIWIGGVREPSILEFSETITNAYFRAPNDGNPLIGANFTVVFVDRPVGTADPQSMVKQNYDSVEKSTLPVNSIVTAFFNLTVLDITFFKFGDDTTKGRVLPIYVEPLNGYYIIEKIDGFIEGRLTKVIMRKII